MRLPVPNRWGQSWLGREADGFTSSVSAANGWWDPSPMHPPSACPLRPWSSSAWGMVLLAQAPRRVAGPLRVPLMPKHLPGTHLNSPHIFSASIRDPASKSLPTFGLTNRRLSTSRTKRGNQRLPGQLKSIGKCHITMQIDISFIFV